MGAEKTMAIYPVIKPATHMACVSRYNAEVVSYHTIKRL